MTRLAKDNLQHFPTGPDATDPGIATHKVGRGRPRSHAATEAVLRAAYECAAMQGAQGTTIEAIAKASGVSKVTIYKWWDDRPALLTDAFLWHIDLEIPLTDSGDAVLVIHKHALRYLAELNGEMGKVLRVVLSECLLKTGDMSVFSERYLKARRELGARIIAIGQANGQIASAATPHFLYDQIYGAIFYRFLFAFPELTPAFVKQLIDHTFQAP